jgi:glutaconate CoA-transferase subunit B
MSDLAYSPVEIMTVAAARKLKNGTVCFVGIGLPSAAANLARITHAPDLVLIYESGTIGAKPDVLPLSIGDGELAETADTVVSVPEIFRYWLQGGRVDIGFLGAAQIDKFGNINTTVIGPYDSPRVRLPGAGGAPEIATAAKEIAIILSRARARLSRGWISSPRRDATQTRAETESRSRAAADLPPLSPIWASCVPIRRQANWC